MLAVQSLLLDWNPLCHAVATLHPILVRKSLNPASAFTFSLNNVSWDPATVAGASPPLARPSLSLSPTPTRSVMPLGMQDWAGGSGGGGGGGGHGGEDVEPSLSGHYKLDLRRASDRRVLARLVDLADCHGGDCWRNASITHTDWAAAAAISAAPKTPVPSGVRGRVGSPAGTSSATFQRRVWFSSESIVESLAFQEEGCGDRKGGEQGALSASHVGGSGQRPQIKGRGGGKGAHHSKAGGRARSETEFPKMGVVSVDVMTPPLGGDSKLEGGDEVAAGEGKGWKEFSQVCPTTPSL
jgi:hypothetical protein